MTGTPRQMAALAFIRQYIAGHGYAPSCDEIAAAIGLKAKSRAHYLLIGLEKRGLIRRMRGWRAIEIVGDYH